jgi:ABC-type sugar transport system ATPase subunit
MAAATSAAVDTGAAAPMLELRGISKTFPGVKALDNVSFPIWAGEIHMLCGENGAGKSSLMKVLCGAYVADAGELFRWSRISASRRTSFSAASFRENSPAPSIARKSVAKPSACSP